MAVGEVGTQIAAPGRALEALLLALADHDPYSGLHSARVADLAGALAAEARLPARLQHLVRHAALAHDVGKAVLPGALLRRRGRLGEAELELVRGHPAAGARLVRNVPGAGGLAAAVLHHHERWDGRGYPAGLAGEQIPLAARLIFVADAFDAMTSARPYGEVLSPAEAVAEIERCAGSQFDPAAVAHLLAVHSAGGLAARAGH